MYSGIIQKQFPSFDAWLGAHQKIDRLARRRLEQLAPGCTFPPTKSVLMFEGRDGPDGIKLKTPARDEPWHFIDPNDPGDRTLLGIIERHIDNLTLALRQQNETRASFEAAWLAHAIVDGLTPAHHYPYEKTLQELRGGKDNSTRTSPKEKLVMHGDTLREKLSNNWHMWGDKGLISTHFAFEWGIAVSILPMRYSALEKRWPPRPAIRTKNQFLEFFRLQLSLVAGMNLYGAFYTSGWTPKLSREVRRNLIPPIVDTVATAWHVAYQRSSRP